VGPFDGGAAPEAAAGRPPVRVIDTTTTCDGVVNPLPPPNGMLLAALRCFYRFPSYFPRTSPILSYLEPPALLTRGVGDELQSLSPRATDAESKMSVSDNQT